MQGYGRMRDEGIGENEGCRERRERGMQTYGRMRDVGIGENEG
jgi:hypothetical protein